MSDPLRPIFHSLRIVAIYASLGSLWILLSDRLAWTLFGNTSYYTYVQTGKGWFYVAVTAVLIYSLVKRSMQIQENAIAASSSDAREKTILLEELHHRVNNSIQLLMSITAIQMEDYTDSPRAVQALEEMSLRLDSIGMVHEEMYQSGNFSAVNMQGHFQNLMNEMTIKSREYGTSIVWMTEGDELLLSVDKAIPLAMLINEFCTAAMTHEPEPDTVSIQYEQMRSGYVQINLLCTNSMKSILGTEDEPNLHGIFIDALIDQLHAEIITDKSGSKSVQNSGENNFRLGIGFSA
ncbi:sensor histidine kinase [Spirochaeta dissipatitropha]